MLSTSYAFIAMSYVLAYETVKPICICDAPSDFVLKTVCVRACQIADPPTIIESMYNLFVYANVLVAAVHMNSNGNNICQYFYAICNIYLKCHGVDMTSIQA